MTVKGIILLYIVKMREIVVDISPASFRVSLEEQSEWFWCHGSEAE